MTRRFKYRSGLSTLALAGSLALAACGGEGEAEGETEGEGAAQVVGEPSAEGEGEGAASEGEGEGEGEGAVARSGDPVDDDVEYLRRLGLVRGHLNAFIELYRGGVVEASMTHAKHPENEIYQDLVPAFAARGLPGFADALAALNAAAKNGGDVEEAYAALNDAIIANEPAGYSVKTLMLAVAGLVATAAEEFDLGVGDDGAVTDPHEYQDAYGMMVAAREMISAAQTSDINASEAISVAHEQIDASLEAFAGLTATQTDGVAATLYGAAARIEIAALGL